MLFVLVLLVVLLVMGVRNGDIEVAEAGIYGAISLVLLVGSFFIRIAPTWFFVPIIFIDIILVWKVFGRDITIH